MYILMLLHCLVSTLFVSQMMLALHITPLMSLSLQVIPSSRKIIHEHFPPPHNTEYAFNYLRISNFSGV